MNELNRREFLKTSVVSSVGLVVALQCRFSSGESVNSKREPWSPNAWLQIHPTGEVVFTLDKAEMGQGVYTTLAMIVAEELEIDPATLKIVVAPASRVYINPLNSIQITGGSTSVSQSFDNLRKAGAMARHLLIAAAAERWKIPTERCEVQSGAVYRKGSSERFVYGELAVAAALIAPPPSVLLKPESEFNIIGMEFQKRLDNPIKVTGKAVFGIDVQIPGLLCAAIIRAPQFGSRVKSFNADEAKKMVGVKAVIEVPTGVAVVAEKYWQVKKARESVTVEWAPDATLSNLDSQAITDLFRKRLSDSGKNVLSRGDVVKSMQGCARVIEAEYELPYLAHATMEPCNFTADVRSDACYLYGPTQSAGIAQQLAVEITGLPYEKVFVETSFLGGGFGRRLSQDYVAEAVHVSKALGKPVKVIWSREDDMQNSMYRPGNLHRLKGGVDSQGALIAWSHKMAGPSILAQVASDYARTSFPKWLPGWAKKMGGWAGERSFGLLSNDTTAMEGASDLAYAAPNVSVDFCLADPGIPIGFWRSVGHSYTGFVVESFIDELAVVAGKDPYEFRRQYLAAPETLRNREVLDLVALKSQWPGKPKKGIGRGIAQHASFGSYVAYVVDVSLSGDNEIIIERVVTAVDCGLVVNPDGARAQMESAVNFGLSAIMKGEITFKAGAVEQSSFDTYEILRFNEAPKTIEIHFAKNAHPPTGLGEPGVPPLAAAVANAICALTGKRLRKMPLRVV